MKKKKEMENEIYFGRAIYIYIYIVTKKQKQKGSQDPSGAMSVLTYIHTTFICFCSPIFHLMLQWSVCQLIVYVQLPFASKENSIQENSWQISTPA